MAAKKTAYQRAEEASKARIGKPVPLEITKILTISTAHLSERDDRLLQANNDPEVGSWFQMSYQGDTDLVGYMVHVTCDDIEEEYKVRLREEGWSPAIAAIQQFAKDHDCDYVRLDPDGPTVDGLETYEW